MTVVRDADIDAYRRDGAVCLHGAFEEHWIEGLRQAVEKDKAEPGPMVRHNTPEGEPGEFFVDFQLWQRWPEARAFVYESPAAEMMAQFMGSSTVAFYHDHLLVKEPGTEAPSPWHHDQPYYPVDGDMVASIWLPLDPVPRAISLEVIAGSHRWGKRFRPKYFNTDNTVLTADDGFTDMPDIEAERGSHEILTWEMEPGDCIVFHSLVVHGAPGNPENKRRRRAYATRWLGEDARYASRPGKISPPLEGHGLVPGDPMTCEMFPRVWPRA